MDYFGTYSTHAQSCDKNVGVQSASGHVLNFRGFAFSRFPIFAFSRLRVLVLYHAQVSPPVFPFSLFPRFRVFVFSRLHVGSIAAS